MFRPHGQLLLRPIVNWLNVPVIITPELRSPFSSRRDYLMLFLSCCFLGALFQVSPQIIINLIFMSIGHGPLEGFLLKTQAFSTFHDYLVANGNPARWERLVSYYLTLPVMIFFYFPMLGYSLRGTLNRVRLAWQNPRHEQFTEMHKHSQTLGITTIIYIAAMVGMAIAIYITLKDFGYISAEAASGTIAPCSNPHARGALIGCALEFFYYDNSIHYSDWGFYHAPIAVLILIALLQLSIGLLPAPIVTYFLSREKSSEFAPATKTPKIRPESTKGVAQVLWRIKIWLMSVMLLFGLIFVLPNVTCAYTAGLTVIPVLFILALYWARLLVPRPVSLVFKRNMFALNYLLLLIPIAVWITGKSGVFSLPQNCGSLLSKWLFNL